MSYRSASLGRPVSKINWRNMFCYRLESLYEPNEYKLEGSTNQREIVAARPHKMYEISSGTNFLRPPSVILNALHQDALDWKYLTWYSGPLGRPLHRGAVRLFEEAVKGSPLTEVDVAITTGGAEALQLAFQYLKSLGTVQSVLIAGPQYPIVYQSLLSAGLTFQEFLSSRRNAFLPDPQEIETALRETDTQALFLTEPNNPSGEQHSPEEFARIISLLKRNGMYLILDKVSSDIAVHPSINTLNYGRVLDDYDYWERTYIIDSLSKRRAISGLRFGYLIGTTSLINFVFEHRIGGCPPNIAIEGIARDLFYSAYWHTHTHTFDWEYIDAQAISSLTDRLKTLSYGASAGKMFNDVEDVKAFYREIGEMYQTIHENKKTCSQLLQPWIVAQTEMQSGFNYLLCLQVASGLDNDFSFATRIFQQSGVATYPLSCFIADSQVATTKRHAGQVWLRISCAVEGKTFTRAIKLVKQFLEQNPAF